MAEEAKWYVVHTYSGYENAVAAAVMKAAENRRMTDLIQEVNIPMEKVTEITDAGEKTVERKVFPGYVLVKMILTDDSWHLIHNVRGATASSGPTARLSPSRSRKSTIWVSSIRRSSSAMRWATRSRSLTGRWPASSASWMSWSPRRTGSASWCPCLDAKRRWIWSSIRSRLPKNKIFPVFL